LNQFQKGRPGVFRRSNKTLVETCLEASISAPFRSMVQWAKRVIFPPRAEGLKSCLYRRSTDIQLLAS
jgi:hypothetical protein